MSKGCICPSGSILTFTHFTWLRVSIPLQVLERVCHSRPPLLSKNCTIQGRDSAWETKMKQYGAPTAMVSWQFSGVQGVEPKCCRPWGNQDGFLAPSTPELSLLTTSYYTRYPKWFCLSGLTSEGLEGENSRGAAMSSSESIQRVAWAV